MSAITDALARIKSQNIRPEIEETFDEATPAWVVDSGTATVAKTTTAGEVWDGAALKISTSTVASEVATTTRVFSAPLDKKVLWQFRWAQKDENLATIFFTLGYRDGTNLYRFRAGHNNSSNVWQVDLGESGAPALTTFLTRDTNEAANIARWNQFTFYADFASNQMLGMLVNDVDYTSTVVGRTNRTGVDATLPGFCFLQVETTNTGTPTASVQLLADLRVWAL